MDFYTNLTFKVQKGRGLGSRDPISKFGTPYITFERIEISASNLAQTTEDRPLLRQDHKTPKWAWPGSRDQILKFWDPSYNLTVLLVVCLGVNDFTFVYLVYIFAPFSRDLAIGSAWSRLFRKFYF